MLLSFLLSIYSWALDLPLRVACFPMRLFLEKTKFLFESCYQLEIAFELEIRAPVHFFQLKEHIWHRPPQALYMLPSSL